MPTKRILLAMALACGLGLAVAPADSLAAELARATEAGHESAGAARMVEELGSRTAEALASPEAQEPAQRREMLRALVRQGFDLELTSQFVLGKHWHRATDEQRAEFTGLFTEYLLNSYAHHLASFRPESLSVVASNPAGSDDILVETSVDGPDGPASPVWRVRAEDGEYKIIDVTVDGMSMALTQRSEFGAVVNQVGLEGLLKPLQRKVDDQAKAAMAPAGGATHPSILGSILSSPNAQRLDLFLPGK